MYAGKRCFGFNMLWEKAILTSNYFVVKNLIKKISNRTQAFLLPPSTIQQAYLKLLKAHFLNHLCVRVEAKELNILLRFK